MTSPICEDEFKVVSDTTKVTSDFIEADYVYETTSVTRKGGKVEVRPVSTQFKFRTKRRVGKTGVLLVGIGGNNGSTLLGGVLSNKHHITWPSKRGEKEPNYFGSLTHATTTCIGTDDETHEQVYVPLRSLVPMVHANDMVLGGWDLNGAYMDEAMARAEVFPRALQIQLAPHMRKYGRPMRSIYYPSFIAGNQEDRVDNVLDGDCASMAHLEHIRRDIREFKARNALDSVIVLWTANTERFCEVLDGIHDSEANLMRAIAEGHPEVAPSQIFAVASILEGCAYINGSPQNTFVPAIQKMASLRDIFIGGDDFKSGQTKIKSVLVDFLVSSGLKPVSIVSYNHLGNNDGKNLAEYKQFRSKEISKSGVVEDMVASNHFLYQPGESPDHCVVIKYVPAVNDSKRAMDEYIASIFMNGWQTFAVHNTCEDSLLATPLMIDLVTFTELFQRVEWSADGGKTWEKFSSILTILSFLLKAPLVPQKSPLVNALFKQRACIENILRAFVGLQPVNDMLLEYKTTLKSKL
jgi:myo-inositol-1-phosphate synthase